MVIKEIFTPGIAITWLPWAVQYFFYDGSGLCQCVDRDNTFV